MDRTLDFFHPVLPAKELRRKPVRVLIAGTPFVLFRDHTRKAQGLIDRCPHRHAPLSAGWVRPDGRLACQYHGWNFDGAGCGRSPTIVDLNCQVPHLAVVERQDFIWIAGPHVSPDTIPGAESPDFHFAGGFSELFPAPLHVALDNFSEDEHTPFIHHRLGWTPEQATQVEFESKNFSDHCEVHYRAPQRVNLVYVRRGDQFNNHWRTYYDPPRIHYHLSWTDPSGTKLRPFEIFVLIYFVPETDRTTRVQSILYVKHEGVFQFLRPLTKKAAVWMVQKEVCDDARFMPVVANTPFEMHGMKLGKFDKPLVQNHKLLKKIYWGEPDEPTTSESE